MNTTRKSQIRRVLALTAGLLTLSPLGVTGASAHAARAVTVRDARICEGNSGTRQLRFNVVLDAPATEPVSVSFITANGSAQAGPDYQAKTGVVSFGVGYSSAVISVPVIGESVDEGNETLSVLLANPQHATLADASAVGTIVDEDPFPLVSISDGQLEEPDSGNGTMVFRASLDCNTGSNVTVNWATSNGSAVAGTDYFAASGTATITAGATLSDPIPVTIRGDLTPEANETLNVSLSSPVNARLGDAFGVGLIINDD